MVSPSDMMDGRVAAIRDALDAEGFTEVPTTGISHLALGILKCSSCALNIKHRT